MQGKIGEVSNKKINSQQLMKQGIELIIFYSFGKSVAQRVMQFLKKLSTTNETKHQTHDFLTHLERG
jgi:hypothetical protein